MSRLASRQGTRASRAGKPARVARARRYHHGDLRPVLLDEVREIIRQQGVGFVSIREVARRARVSHAAPAHHFGSKSGLLTAFAVQGYERLAALTAERIAGARASSSRDVLAVMGQAYVEFAVANPEHFGIMYPGDALKRRDPDLRRASERCYGPLVDVVRRADAEGCLDRDVETVTAAAWALVHGLASLWLGGVMQPRIRATDAAALSRAVTRLFVETVLHPRTTG